MEFRERLGKMDLKAFLFDMDGVLYDSMRNHAEAWVRAMKQCNLTMTTEEVYMNEGRTGEGTIDIFTQREWGRAATQDEIEHIYKVKADIFNTLPPTVEMPGAKEVLDRVMELGLMHVLVTGSGQKSLLDKLNHSYPGIFTPELMVTAFDVKYGKPNPEPYIKGLEKVRNSLASSKYQKTPEQTEDLESVRNRCMVVENAPLGIQAAKGAGIYTIAVNTGPLPDKVLWDAGADIVFPSMKALADAL